MPFISEVTIRLRFETVRIIDKLIITGKCKNQKEAFKYVITKAKKLCGFSTNKKGYNQYIMFKQKYYSEDIFTNDNDDVCIDAECFEYEN